MKIPPLKCPQCGSEKVAPGFSKRKRNAFIRDGKIYCYDCMQVTDKKGKIKSHTYHAHKMGKED